MGFSGFRHFGRMGAAVLAATPIAPAIPLLLPGAAWPGTASAAPTQSDTVYDAVAFPNNTFRRVRGGFLDAVEGQTVGNEAYFTLQVIGAGSTVSVTCEGNTVDAPFTTNPVTGNVGYVFRIASSATQNGWARVNLIAPPIFGGMALTETVLLHLNTAPTAAGFIPTIRRYVGKNGSDGNNGTTPALAFRTPKAMVDSVPVSGANSAKTAIWEFHFDVGARGDIVWGANVGTLSGVPRVFTYQPIFIGDGANRSSYLTIDDAALGYIWNAMSFGNKAAGGNIGVWRNLTVDFKMCLQKSLGGWLDDCELTDDLGPNRPTFMGYPKAIYDGGNFGNAMSSGPGFSASLAGNCRWNDDSASFETRWTVSNCDVNMAEFGTVHQRWNNRVRASYDVFFVNRYGRWLHQRDDYTQVGLCECALHSDDYLTVLSATPSPSNGGYTTVTFDAGPTIKNVTAIEAGNTFLRVLEAANPTAASAQTPFPVNADGTRDFPYLGHAIKPSTGFAGGNGWDYSTRTCLIDGQHNLAPGDKVMALVIAHGDAGQFNTTAAPHLWAPRENFTRVNCTWRAHTWQGLLIQPGWVNAAGTGVGNSNTNLTGVTMDAAAASKTLTFPGGVPACVKLHDWIGHGTTASDNVLRCVMRIVDANNIEIHEAFPTALVGKAVRVRKGITGYYEINTIGHKSGERDEVAQIEAGVCDVLFQNCTYPGWTDGGQNMYIRASGTSDSSGYLGLRFLNTITWKIQMGDTGAPWPSASGVIWENCHNELAAGQPGAIPADRVIGGLGAGVAFGYPVRTGPHAQNYVPGAAVTKTNLRSYWPAMTIGARIGATRG